MARFDLNMSEIINYVICKIYSLSVNEGSLSPSSVNHIMSSNVDVQSNVEVPFSLSKTNVAQSAERASD